MANVSCSAPLAIFLLNQITPFQCKQQSITNCIDLIYIFLNQIDILSIACQRFPRFSDCLLPRQSFSFTLPLSPCKRRNPQRQVL